MFRRSLQSVAIPLLAKPKNASFINPSLLYIRYMSLLMDFDDDSDRWPKIKGNAVINVCPRGCKMIVERLGKFHGVREGVLQFLLLIPFDM
jgi:hypothetical protein